MRFVLGAAFAVLLALPAARAEDKPKEPDKPPAPQEQFAALSKEYQAATSAIRATVKSPEDQQKAQTELRAIFDKFAPRFLEIAEKHPTDPAALDALSLVLGNSRNLGGGKSEAGAKTVALLRKDHLTSDRMGRLCQTLRFGCDGSSDALLREVIEKNPHATVQAEACMALANSLSQRAGIARRMKDDPQLAKAAESALGKDTAAELMAADAGKLEAEGEKVTALLADKYLPEMKPEQLANLFQQFTFGPGKSGEVFVRKALEKDARKDVQGMACVTLAQMLKSRADTEVEKDPKAADAVRKEAEELFQRAIDKFADVKMGFRGTVGEIAKGELYEIRHLAVGQVVPAVEGEDQDGKKFKLADYKGKVVLLDFWSEF